MPPECKSSSAPTTGATPFLPASPRTALAEQGFPIRYLQGYKRVLPLTRLLAKNPCDLLHLHWPEAYYPAMRDHRVGFAAPALSPI